MTFNSSSLREEPDPNGLWLDCLTEPRLNGGAYPSDIDSTLEISGAFLFFEHKKPGEGMKAGQERYLKNLDTLVHPSTGKRATVGIIEAAQDMSSGKWYPGVTWFYRSPMRLTGPEQLRWWVDWWTACARMGRDVWELDSWLQQCVAKGDFYPPSI